LIALLLGGSMLMSLPWTLPLFGEVEHFDSRSFLAIIGSTAVCGVVGGALFYLGRTAKHDSLFRKEAIAIVGLSWLMATLLGALPFWLSATCSGYDGDTPVRMDFCDGLFESSSGFSGTGATVLQDLEDPELVPRAILFWRSETHFLGGLGIMVLFVAVLGLGSAGKALMLTEMPGPTQESSHARVQRAAWAFAAIFVGLTAILTVALLVQGVSLFDALSHAFGTIATGGFSTYNKSVEHFDSVSIEITIAVFMAIACTSFTLLYYVVLLKPGKLLADIEFRVYLGIMFLVMLAIGASLYINDVYSTVGETARYASFQVISIQTNTGFGTANFDEWDGFSRGTLLLLMFIGGCAGSTSCSIKVIRHILFVKIIWLEVEKVFHPSVVRPVRLGGKPLDDPDLRKDILLYFGVILIIFVVGWLGLIACEPDTTWSGIREGDKLIDCASAVAATINGVGPGLGICGESQNYAQFNWASKLILTWLMLLGRLEVFVLLALFAPRFWRSR
jgi:trk system potassium uptake protein TrkH